MNLFWENIRLALSSLKANKMRSLLTMLGIIIGISSVIAIMTVGNSLSSYMADSMMSMGANNVNIYLDIKDREDEVTKEGYVFKADEGDSSYTDDEFITDEMIETFCDTYQDKIYAISASINAGQGNIVVQKKNAQVNITGCSVGYFVANNVELVAGRPYTAQEMEEGRNLAIISSKAANDLYGDVESAVGEEIAVGTGNTELTYTIVGVYKYEEDMMASMIMGGNAATGLYIPLKTAKELNHQSGYTNFSVMINAGVDADNFAREAKSFFLSYYRNNRNLTVEAMSMASMVETFSGMMDKLTLAISVIAGIALLVGGIGVMNIMLVSITERTREIGTRKALGAPNSSIRTQFIVEAVIICLIGGAIGVMLGIGLGALGAKLLEAPASPSASSIIGSLLFSMAIGIFFGYYPANKAAKMDPIEALRYE